VARTCTKTVNGVTLAFEALFTDYQLSRSDSGELTFSVRPRLPGRRHRPHLELSMGYRKTTRRLEVSLKGHKVFGLDDEFPVAQVRGKNLDEYLRLIGYIEVEEGDDRDPIVRQLEEFGDSLISWNLETEDGTPLPATRESLFGIDNDLAIALANRWVDVLGGKVDDASPLPDSSPSGEPSLVASIPTETLSVLPPPTSVPA
jgi:hypothetical protein